MRNTLQKIVDSYLATALWSSNDWDDLDECGNPEPFDSNYDVSDFSDDARQQAYEDCKEFVEFLECVENEDGETLFDCAEDLQGADRIGHDFWLTRNGHGAGFWDGDYGDYGDLISEIVNDNFAECNIFAGSDGDLFFE